jgi:hypothetical protein
VGGVNHPIKDPYSTCEAGRCSHDLARAVTIDDLIADDGPFPPSQMIVNLSSSRVTLFDDMEEPLEGQVDMEEPLEDQIAV